MDCRETVSFLKQRDHYLIIAHRRPDGDTIGCSAGLCRALRRLGKTAYVLPSLDATALLAGHLDGLTAPEGFAPDTVVSVDTAALGLLPDNARPFRDSIDLAIDHHPSQEFFAKETCLEADKAACGEIVWKICTELGAMDGSIAAPLYVAVSTDTGCFMYSNTTANTHRVAAALIEAGAPFQELNKKHFRTRTMTRLRLESLLLQEIRLYFDGTVAVAPVSLDLRTKVGATDEDMEDIAAFAGQIEGVLHSVTIRESAPGECRLSVRSKAELLDAGAVCARFGGGGHKAAAGCTIKGTVAEAERAVIAAMAEQMDAQSHG